MVIEFWGIHCGPCIASMPHLSKLAAEGAGKGLVVIGCHAQESKKDEAIAICTRQGVNYTIYANGSVPDKMTFKMLPHTFVFDYNGKIIFEGEPSGIDPVIKKAMADRPNPLLGDMKYAKLTSAVTMVKAGRLGAAMKECQKYQDKEGDAAKEAAFMLPRLEKHLKKLQDAAGGDRDTSPMEVQDALTTLKQEFQGTDDGTQAADTLKTLAADKDFRKNLAAEKEYKLISAAMTKIGAPPTPPATTPGPGRTHRRSSRSRAGSTA